MALLEPNNILRGRKCEEIEDFVKTDAEMEVLIESLSREFSDDESFNILPLVLKGKPLDSLARESLLQIVFPDHSFCEEDIVEFTSLSHDTLLRCCLNYLQSPQVRQRSPATRGFKEVFNPAEIRSQLPFLDYACLSWKFHAYLPDGATGRDPSLLLVSTFGSVGNEVWNTFVGFSAKLRGYDLFFDNVGISQPSLLHFAVCFKLSSTVQALLERGESVDPNTHAATRVLRWAIRRCQNDTVITLIKSKACSPASPWALWKGVLELAIHFLEPDVVSTLLEHGGQPGNKTLNHVFDRDRAEILELDLRQKEGLRLRQEELDFREEPLEVLPRRASLTRKELDPKVHVAISRGRKDILRGLLEHQADVNRKEFFWGSALEAAANYYKDEETSLLMVKLLLEYGARAEFRGGKDATSLKAARLGGNGEVVDFLLLYMEQHPRRRIGG